MHVCSHGQGKYIGPISVTAEITPVGGSMQKLAKSAICQKFPDTDPGKFLTMQQTSQPGIPFPTMHGANTVRVWPSGLSELLPSIGMSWH